MVRKGKRENNIITLRPRGPGVPLAPRRPGDPYEGKKQTRKCIS